MRDLRSIEEEFVILNRYKELLIKEKEKSEDKEKLEKEINTVDNIMEDIQIEVNKWANNYNEYQEEKIEVQNNPDNNEEDLTLIDLFEDKKDNNLEKEDRKSVV